MIKEIYVFSNRSSCFTHSLNSCFFHSLNMYSDFCIFFLCLCVFLYAVDSSIWMWLWIMKCHIVVLWLVVHIIIYSGIQTHSRLNNSYVYLYLNNERCSTLYLVSSWSWCVVSKWLTRNGLSIARERTKKRHFLI